ncbi:MAG: hypothetical protein LBD01_01590 [Puniceicoccales bacterium]|jgi:hypothetical protein|nr:hypothetical protein [Puniceicoccales bacterium]
MHPDKLVSRIKAVLSGDTGHFEVQGLALEYSELVMNVRDRIDQCVTLIRAGDNYAALQVAESPPPLLDTAAKLAFAESPQWLEFCRERNIPWPPPLEQRNIDLINSLYGQRISESHPLYRDYRTAIRERDELRALLILASIIRINPDDKNARQEFIRLGEKVRNTHLRRLENLLDAHDDAAAFALAETLENLRLHAFANAPALLRARERREIAEREKAHDDALTALQQALPLHEAGDWQAVIPWIGRCRALEHHFKLELDEASRQQLAALEKWATDCENAQNARIAHEKNIVLANQKLESTIAWTQGSRNTRSQLKLGIGHLGSIIQRAQSLAAKPSATAAIDAALLHQATQLLRKLKQRIRLHNLLLASAFVVIFCLASIATFFIQAHFGGIQQRKEAMARMEVSLSENRLGQAEICLASLNPHWDSEPDFAAAKKKFATWIATNRVGADNALAESARLVALMDIQDPATLQWEVAALGRLKQQAETLPVDINAIVQQRLAETTTRFNTFRANVAASVLPDFAHQLEAASITFAGIRIIGELPKRLAASTAFKATLSKLNATGEPLQFLMPSELAQRWKSFATEVADTHAQWLISERAGEALAAARTLDSYIEVIRTSIVGVPESQSKPFARIFACETALRDPVNVLLTPTARQLWQVAATTPIDTTIAFRPAEILPEENLAAARLAQQGKTIEILYRHTHHKYPIAPKATGSVIHTIGQVREERIPYGAGYERRQAAQVFKLDGTTEKRTYSLRQFGNLGANGEVLLDSRKAPESLFLVQFSRFYDIKTGQISEPLLDTLGRLRAANISLLLKAYLHLEILKIIEARPAEWGILFSPSAQAAAGQLPQLTQGALTYLDWLQPERWADRIPALRNFYDNSTANYKREAEAWLRVFQRMTRPGFTFVGHITAAKKFRITTTRPLTGGIVGITPEGYLTFLPLDEALEPASDQRSRLRTLRTPELFAEHSPILMLPFLPDQAARATQFPDDVPTPRDGWLRFTFMTQEQIQNQQDASNQISTPTSAVPNPAPHNAAQIPTTPEPEPTLPTAETEP